jgi:hypothetical protein
LEATEFYKKWIKKIIAEFLLSFSSKLDHFDKNIYLKSQVCFINLEKTEIALVYGEARGHLELRRYE